MSEKQTREKIKSQSIPLISLVQLEYVKTKIGKLPIDPEHPIEIVIREQVKKRKLSLNDAMWAGPLKDIEEQAIHDDRQFDAKIWHEHLKELFLPDEEAHGCDPSHILDGYQKWAIDPWNGRRRLKGSTTQLTDAGMRLYLLQIEAYAATTYGVIFTERVEPIGRMK